MSTSSGVPLTSRVAIGIDVGGTFTDLAALHDDGTVQTTKVLSVATDRAAGVLDALHASRIAPEQVRHLAHGTTVVTNLLLERRGARVVACATAGFTDLLELRRQERASLYDLTRHHPAPLVERAHTVAVPERLSPDAVLLALSAEHVADVVHRVVALKPETVAVTLLHAYGNPVHEIALRDALRAGFTRAGIDADVICSHEVLPEIREYERMATTVAEAYARPAVRAYLSGLSSRLVSHGFPAPRVMTSAGGTLTSEEAARHAAALALSGPAGGVTGSAAIARLLNIPHALTIDIGGTSADVGVIENGEPLVERGGGVAGIPIALPRVLVEAVAAGGGSIGWIDEGGALRAGPESAGAAPGPAAYDRGGERPTLTDAHVVLGHVAPGEWSGGVRISLSRAEHALRTIAEPLGVSIERAAEVLLNTADATMARALRRVSVERGVDPRDVALIAFGGGGPLHACGLADRLGISRIVVPPHAGVLSAVGLALAPERRESLVSYVTRTEDIHANAFGALLSSAAETLRAGADLKPKWWVRARYIGQGYELDVPVEPGVDGSFIAREFAKRHEARTGFTLPREVECISVRITLSGAPANARFVRPERSGVIDGGHDDGLDDGRAMSRTVEGKSVIRLPDATMLVAAGWRARAMDIGGWMLERT